MIRHTIMSVVNRSGFRVPRVFQNIFQRNVYLCFILQIKSLERFSLTVLQRFTHCHRVVFTVCINVCRTGYVEQQKVSMYSLVELSLVTAKSTVRRSLLRMEPLPAYLCSAKNIWLRAVVISLDISLIDKTPPLNI